MPRLRCLSTRVEGFAQPEHICQVPLQPAGSQSELPGSASEKLNLSCSACLTNISLCLQDLITPSLIPQKAGRLRYPGKQGSYVLLQRVGYYLEIAGGHFCCLCKSSFHLPRSKQLTIVRGQKIPMSEHPDGWLIKEDPSSK